MWSWLRRVLSRASPPPYSLVQAELPLDVLIRKLQEPKEVRLTTRADGSLAGMCKACATSIRIAEKDGLMWYVCPACKRASFTPLANIRRDIELARRMGGTFEYEVYFFRELPPGFEPPEACRAEPGAAPDRGGSTTPQGS